jgi:hypothetical protein
MATRTVRLDDEAEATLEEIRRETGLPISEALKRGLRELQRRLRDESDATPYDVFARLDLGVGGDAIAPADKVREGVRTALEKKHRR